MKGIEELNQWREIPHLWIRRPNIVKIPIFPNLTYRYNVILIRNPSKLFFRFWQIGFKVFIVRQGLRMGKHNVEGEEQSQRTDTTSFQDLP